MKINNAILGAAIGDALGVPVEFSSRQELKNDPITDMTGYGGWNQPPGTWSDDTSMILCLLDSLSQKGHIDYKDIMDKFILWKDFDEYTANDVNFDIGTTTASSLRKYQNGIEPLECGGKDINSNGNGSLMRILPLAFYLHNKYPSIQNSSIDDVVNIIRTIDNISSLTHGHLYSKISCEIFIFICLHILEEETCIVHDEIDYIIKIILSSYEEVTAFDRLRDIRSFKKLPENEIKSDGYVVHTLEAALWCLLNTSSFETCVLKAVNLGGDTDTTACVAGGLAGLFYDTIPQKWIDSLIKKDYIIELCNNFSHTFNIKE